MDKVTDDFTHGQGATDYGKILDRLIEDLIMNNIGITIQIDGGHGVRRTSSRRPSRAAATAAAAATI